MKEGFLNTKTSGFLFSFWNLSRLEEIWFENLKKSEEEITLSNFSPYSI